jgi:hypothetical protein
VGEALSATAELGLWRRVKQDPIELGVLKGCRKEAPPGGLVVGAPAIRAKPGEALRAVTLDSSYKRSHAVGRFSWCIVFAGRVAGAR